jgi:NAD(P)-dependent dehydrogenase (short-subunit alcohol dehydrogenase family)
MGLRPPPPAERSMLPADALAGEIALVTGGGSGLGLAMALGLARCGARIAITSRTTEALEKGLAQIRATGAEAIAVPADVREPEQIASAFDQVEAQLGPVSLLLNNAGTNFPALAGEMSPNAWRAIVRIALDGTFFCCREFYRRRKPTGLPGAIVNNGATYAWTGFPGDAHSCAAKAATLNLTQTLAGEWAGDGIRVNAIVAGFYPHEKIPDPDNTMGRVTPAGRNGEMQEIGWMAAYLCSRYASFVTGLNMVIDGAEWLRREALYPDYVPPPERGEAIW